MVLSVPIVPPPGTLPPGPGLPSAAEAEAWHDPSVGIVGLDHVQFTLPPGGEPEADRFYIDLLEFEAEEKPPALAARGGRWYRSGAARFHLGADARFAPAERAHPAFVVDDLHGLAGRLARAGVAVEWDSQVEGVARCYVHDPFGNRLELVAAADPEGH
jgi:catechol 2,3-dioxygenase-like lactoylglutathione lyase family enzyme